MSKSNKSAKEKLIKLYGEECFIEKLHLRQDKGRRYTSKGQMKRMKQLTYHHILEKSKGGKATVENGALLSAENHEWFNQQSKEEQRRMNDMFQQYKLGIVEFTTEKVKKAVEISLPVIEEDYIEIPVEPMTEEELKIYEEHKKKRNEKVFRKFEEMER